MISKRLLGVLGGMGPLATIDFLSKLLSATPAKTDQEHIPFVAASIPQVPDRTAAFLGEGESPLPGMIESGKRLLDAGASLIVIPCNTAHLWYEPVQEALGVPMIHLVDSAVEDAATYLGRPADRIGLLATDATVASGLYVNLKSASSAGVNWLLPTAGEMVDLVSPGIAAVKAGDTKLGEQLLAQAAAALGKRGAKAIVLGCTEIPVVLNDANSPVPVVDATASLARRAVAWAMGRIDVPVPAVVPIFPAAPAAAA
ncbi:aspartate/glutamate racemase family protein [Xenophilus sp. Marseille-Q4582]|uniref:aspartate/glutamate racemase family protein n=1 Tax=Xenophilus sp. Marseille-Q4582 TaxID=2866600 RepID=UPI001CE4851A|nr:amino acid racemase [Xenophilus sp. Marseille-Q4582]